MNFSFRNLLGAPYRGGTILLSKGDSLLAPVGNRVNEVRRRWSRRERNDECRSGTRACFCSLFAPVSCVDVKGEIAYHPSHAK